MIDDVARLDATKLSNTKGIHIASFDAFSYLTKFDEISASGILTMNPHPEKIYHSVTFRCLEFVRPHLRLIVGAALMGVGKFTLPLAFPLAFKYVVDVLLTTSAKLDWATRFIDHWCIALVNSIGETPTPTSKLTALSIVMLALYALQALASYYRNHWAGIAGNRL